MLTPRVLYERELPGGGFVQVEEDQVSPLHKAHVAVERRSDPARRSGHAPPIIAQAEVGNSGDMLQRLLAIARDNVEIAKGLLRLKGDGKAKF